MNKRKSNDVKCVQEQEFSMKKSKRKKKKKARKENLTKEKDESNESQPNVQCSFAILNELPPFEQINEMQEVVYNECSEDKEENNEQSLFSENDKVEKDESFDTVQEENINCMEEQIELELDIKGGDKKEDENDDKNEEEDEDKRGVEDNEEFEDKKEDEDEEKNEEEDEDKRGVEENEEGKMEDGENKEQEKKQERKVDNEEENGEDEEREVIEANDKEKEHVEKEDHVENDVQVTNQSDKKFDFSNDLSVNVSEQKHQEEILLLKQEIGFLKDQNQKLKKKEIELEYLQCQLALLEGGAPLKPKFSVNNELFGTVNLQTKNIMEMISEVSRMNKVLLAYIQELEGNSDFAFQKNLKI